jgi:hypothetical protein
LWLDDNDLPHHICDELITAIWIEYDRLLGEWWWQVIDQRLEYVRVSGLFIGENERHDDFIPPEIPLQLVD